MHYGINADIYMAAFVALKDWMLAQYVEKRGNLRKYSGLDKFISLNNIWGSRNSLPVNNIYCIYSENIPLLLNLLTIIIINIYLYKSFTKKYLKFKMSEGSSGPKVNAKAKD